MKKLIRHRTRPRTCRSVRTRRARAIRFRHRLRSYAIGPRHYADRTRRAIHLQPIPADRAGTTDLFQHRQDCDDCAASLQRRQAAIPTRASDDSCAVDALSAVLVSRHRPKTAATNLEHLWQFDGVAQLREHRKRGRSLLPAGKRANYDQRSSRLPHRQRCRPTTDCGAGSHR